MSDVSQGSTGQGSELLVVAYGSERFADQWFRNAQVLGCDLALADNHRDGRSAAAAAELAPGYPGVAFRSEVLDENPGFGRACNRLAATSTAERFVFVNPDAAVSTPFSRSELREGRIVGAHQTRSDGQYVHASGIDWRVRDEIARAWLRRTPKPPTGRGYVSGGAFAVTAHDFRLLGGFDESYFLFYEDIDLCLRAAQHGIEVVESETWRVTHDPGHAIRTDWSFALHESFRSGDHFHNVHKHSVAGYRAFVTIDAVMRALLSAARRETDKAKAYVGLARTAVSALAKEIRR